MTLTVGQFARCTGATLTRASGRHQPYMAAMAFYDIGTRRRVAFFLANVGHECGGFQWPSEIWGREPTSAQRRYERDFGEPWPASDDDAALRPFEANRLAYALGNREKGDGFLFRGHGDIQVTGRFNHAAVTRRLRALFPALDVPDFEAEPERLTEPQWAAMSACDYVDMKKCNEQADADNFDHYVDLINRGRVTRVIGDSNGYADRMIRLHACYAALGLTKEQP